MSVTGKAGIQRFDAGTGDLLGRLSDLPCWDIKWSPDHRILVSAQSIIPSQKSNVTFHVARDNGSLAQSVTFPTVQRLDDWDVSSDNALMAGTFYPKDTLELIDLRSGESLWSIPNPKFSASVDISKDGNYIAVGGSDLLVVDSRNTERQAKGTGFDNNINTVMFSPSGNEIAASSYDGKIRIFKLDAKAMTLKKIHTLSHSGTANVYSLVFFAAGTKLISVSGDKTLRIWGQPLRK